MMTLCGNCGRKNCTMTNNGDCTFYTEDSNDNFNIDLRNRRERRAEERLKKKLLKRKKK